MELEQARSIADELESLLPDGCIVRIWRLQDDGSLALVVRWEVDAWVGGVTPSMSLLTLKMEGAWPKNLAVELEKGSGQIPSAGKTAIREFFETT